VISSFTSCLDYIFDKLNVTSLSFGLPNSCISSFPNYCSFLLYTLLSKKYGLKEIHIKKDDDFALKLNFKEKAKDVVLQVLHKTPEGVWKQSLHCKQVMLK
jgi:hypothetical protein